MASSPTPPDPLVELEVIARAAGHALLTRDDHLRVVQAVAVVEQALRPDPATTPEN